MSSARVGCPSTAISRSASASRGSQDVHDAVGAADGCSVGVGAADADRGGAQGEGLDDVGARADSGVEQNRRPLSSFDDTGRSLDRGQATVGLAASVVGAVDAVDPVVFRPPHVLGVADPLQDQR